jgi:hypothetical protein
MSTDNRFELKAQKLPEAEYPKEIWFSALNAYREIGLRQGGATSDRVNAIVDAILAERGAERERCAKIADAQAVDWLQGVKKANSIEALNYANGRQDGAQVIAAAIRKGGE